MNRHIFTLLRPHQWLKNVFVFMPLFFDRHATDWCYVWPCTVAFVAFCLTASGVYCFNDIHDAASDRQHPVKRMRPVASGSVSKPTAYTLMCILWVAAFTLLTFCCPITPHTTLTSPHSPLTSYHSPLTSYLLLIYIILNLAYSVKLKQIALLDVFIIATGFVLRIMVGGQSAGIALSHWIVLTTFLLALFLALAKRRDDAVIHQSSGSILRKNITRYSLEFLDLSIAMLGGVTIVCYVLYTVSDEVVARTGSQHLYATSVFVLAGILRYMQLTFVDRRSGSPTKVLLHDHFIHLCIAGWIAAFAIILYT